MIRHPLFVTSCLCALLGALGCGDHTFDEANQANSWETSELMPETSELPTRTAPERYTMRDGTPVPEHAGSFVKIAIGYGRECVIDDFAQLLCWQTDTYEQEAPEVDYIEPIAQQVSEMSLHGETLCIIQGDEGTVACLGDDEAFEPVRFDGLRGPAKDLSTHYSDQVCVLDSGSYLHCVFEPSYGERSGELVQIELAQRHQRPYKIFRLDDSASTRIQSRCAVDTQNTLHCWSGVNYSMSTDEFSGVNISVSPIRGSIDDMRADRFGVVAWLVYGTVELWRFNPWAYGSTEPPTLERTITGSYTKLYSSDCGQRTDGAVVCWGSGEEVIVLEEEPRDLHVTRYGYGMYGISADGEIFSQDFEY